MDLGFGSGEKTEWISFKPSANGWLMDGEEVDLNGKGILVDPSSIKTGWMKIAQGMAPDCLWDEKVGRRGERPSEDHKRGFSVMVMPKVKVEDGMNENWKQWQSNSVGAFMGLQDLLSGITRSDKDAFSKNDGKVIQAKYTGSKINDGGVGKTRIPQFDFLGWGNAPTSSQIDVEAEQRKDMEESQSSKDIEDDDISNLFAG